MWRWIQQFDLLLRGELTGLPVLRLRGLQIPVLGVAVIIDLLGMIYGVCMGSFALTGSGSGAAMQIPASMLKVPALYLLTLIVTLPSLYVFNALLNSRLTFPSTTRLLLCALAVMLAVLSSAGPIVAFFSLCTSSYAFMVLLNVLVFSLAGVFGLAFMLQTLHRMTLAIEWPTIVDPESSAGSETPASDSEALSKNETAQQPAIGPETRREIGREIGHETESERLWARSSTRQVFLIWLIIFALVGAQMGWVLRPFIGHPGTPFSWFRPRQSNFFEAVASDIRQLVGTHNP